MTMPEIIKLKRSMFSNKKRKICSYCIRTCHSLILSDTKEAIKKYFSNEIFIIFTTYWNSYKDYPFILFSSKSHIRTTIQK